MTRPALSPASPSSGNAARANPVSAVPGPVTMDDNGGRDSRARANPAQTPAFVLGVPDGLVEVIASRAAELVLERLPTPSASEYLTVDEAAEFLRAKPQRVYDLLSARRLTRFKDGSRVLVSRRELAEYVAGRVAPALPRRSQTRSLRTVAR